MRLVYKLPVAASVIPTVTFTLYRLGDCTVLFPRLQEYENIKDSVFGNENIEHSVQRGKHRWIKHNTIKVPRIESGNTSRDGSED